MTDKPRAIAVPIHRYRVMFSDGTVEDFLAANDNSTNRGVMLTLHNGRRKASDIIMSGVVDLGVEYEHHPSVP